MNEIKMIVKVGDRGLIQVQNLESEAQMSAWNDRHEIPLTCSLEGHSYTSLCESFVM